MSFVWCLSAETSHNFRFSRIQILQHSSVKILSDDIFLDIAPGDAFSGVDTKVALPADSGHIGEATSKNTSTVKKSSSKFPFIAGMGVGAGLMFLVSSKR